jgi:hypothetical protein
MRRDGNIDTRRKLDRSVLRFICALYAGIGICIGAGLGWHVAIIIYIVAVGVGWINARWYDSIHPPVD